MTQPAADVRPARRVRRWISSLSFRQMGWAVVIVVLAATALFGGLDTVDKRVTTFTPGEEFSDGEFTVTVERAKVVPELRAGTTVLAPAKPGRRYLGVVAKLRNDGNLPGGITDELDLRGLPDKQWIGAMRIADGSRTRSLGPGLTDEFAFIWELPEDAVRNGDSVTFRIWQKEFVQRSVTYGEGWIDSVTEYGEVAVKVETGQ